MNFFEKKLHYYYLFTSAVYILIYVFITPPFYSNDEYSHFQKAASKEKIYLNGGLLISSNAKEFADLFYYIQLKTYIDPKYGDKYKNLEIRKNIRKEKSKKYLDQFIESNKTNFNYSSHFYRDIYAEYNWNKKYINASLINLIGYPITGYVFSKLGIELSKIFSEKVYLSFYIGRLFNAIFCIVIIFLALKHIKSGRDYLFAIFSLPTVLKLSGSFSQDGIIFAYSLLIVLIINILNKDRIFEQTYKKNLLLICFVLLLFISCARPTYFVFFSLLLIFCSKKYTFNKTLLIYLPLLVSSLFFFLFVKYYPMPIKPVQFTDGTSNIDFLISNPLIIFKILMNDLINNFYKYSAMFIGFMGHGNFYLDYKLLIFVGFIFFLIFIYNIFDKKIFKLKNLYIILICFTSITVIQVLQYIYSTEAGRTDLIQGVDARYFVPTMIFLSLIFNNLDTQINYNLKIAKNTLLFMFPHFNIFVLFEIYNFFYFPRF